MPVPLAVPWHPALKSTVRYSSVELYDAYGVYLVGTFAHIPAVAVQGEDHTASLDGLPCLCPGVSTPRVKEDTSVRTVPGTEGCWSGSWSAPCSGGSPRWPHLLCCDLAGLGFAGLSPGCCHRSEGTLRRKLVEELTSP